MQDRIKTPVDGHCNRCLGSRRHDVLHREQTSWDEPLDEDGRDSISGADTYDMLRCCGCGNITLRHSSWFSEETDPRGVPIARVRYYPPAVSRREPEWLFELTIDEESEYLAEMLGEVYVALQSGLTRLATMGIRALLEHLMILKVGDQGSFAQNLGAFEEEGYVSRIQKATLEATLEAGHAVMHRMHKPNAKELGTLVDITEGLVEGLYIHPSRVSQVKQRIPPRPRSRKDAGQTPSSDEN